MYLKKLKAIIREFLTLVALCLALLLLFYTTAMGQAWFGNLGLKVNPIEGCPTGWLSRSTPCYTHPQNKPYMLWDLRNGNLLSGRRWTI